ncbi:MAG: ABC transporter ATP-binding protein [Phycisphaerae bacterium]|jgi:branched-chain amino acid transport system ATP-binding protein|nr:MAG: ABC transporter ATP-binding protein [Phycisphaerae bacterium]
MTAAKLEVQNVTKIFGGLTAVRDFSIVVETGQLQGLIGPNGAGKTTCFNLLTGVYRPDAGKILLNGKRIDGRRPSSITSSGIARTFQNIRLFRDLTVLDNVRVACHLRARHTLVGALLRLPNHYRDEAHIRAHSIRLLERFGLLDRSEELAGNLPYGDQRRLEIARALATDPKILLLDEPAAGMNPAEKIALKELIRQLLKDFPVGILLIEHDMDVVMDLCDRITVLDYGQIIATGKPEEIQCDEKVIEAYLGCPAHSVEEAVQKDLERGTDV